jgi:hypothetical protein
MLPGQIVIRTNCGGFGCRSFAFTPKILSTDPNPRLRAGELETHTYNEKKAILHNFGNISPFRINTYGSARKCSF